MIVNLLIVLALLLISTLVIGAPVSFSLGFTAIGSIFLLMSPSHLIQMGNVALTQGTSMNQLVAPLFILMAEFLARGDVASDIFDVLNRLLIKIKGGLAVSTVFACTVFAALCGSSPATAAAIGRVSISQMQKHGYRSDFAAGTVAASGTLGIMIPPSITFVMYGIITENSIAKLLIAGILPGLMLSALITISIIIRVRLNPGLAEQTSQEPEQLAMEMSLVDGVSARESEADKSEKSIGKSLMQILPAIVLIFVVLGSMYTGLATPTESAGVGAVGAFIIIVFLRRCNIPLFREVLRATAKTSTMILFMAICGLFLSYVVSYLGIAQNIANAITSLHVNRYVVIIFLYILWYIMGCLMDPGSMVILTIPFIYPTVMALGFNPIWLGVVSTLCVEVGMITPPVGFNLFIIRSISDVPIIEIMKGVIPYVFILTLGLIILTVFPEICLYLPSRM